MKKTLTITFVVLMAACSQTPKSDNTLSHLEMRIVEPSGQKQFQTSPKFGGAKNVYFEYNGTNSWSVEPNYLNNKLSFTYTDAKGSKCKSNAEEIIATCTTKNGYTASVEAVFISKKI
jgi:hypothetical protein